MATKNLITSTTRLNALSKNVVVKNLNQKKMNNNQTPFTDLIDTFPNLFGKGGSKRQELERKADSLNVDWDKIHGLDDGEGPWNAPRTL